MARPTKFTESMGAKVVFRLPLNLDEMLRADGIAKGVSISELLREAVALKYAPQVQVTQVQPVTKIKAKTKAKTKAKAKA
jgi:hypothetical protein